MAMFSITLFCCVEIGILHLTMGLRQNQFGLRTEYDQFDVPVAFLDEFWKIESLPGYTCEVVHTIGVYRQGSWNPGANYIRTINNLAATLNESSSFDLEEWHNTITENEKYLLNTKGGDEMIKLGKRMATRVASAFNYVSILTTSSDGSAEKMSARKYLEGLLSTLAHNFDELGASVKTNNMLLRFYDDCEKYRKSVVQNRTAMEEIEQFDESQTIRDTTQRIKNKLGLPNDYTFSMVQVEAVFQYCAFEMALFNKSVWCDALTDEDLAVLEYRKDLQIYWQETYGYPINYEMACPLWSNIIGGIKHAVDDKNALKQKSANFLFGHSETLFGLFAALGLYKDTEPLMADGMEKQKNRKLKSSEAMPFSANLVFVVYRCNDTVELVVERETYRNTHIIKLFHNEKEINFPGVSVGYVPYDFLQSKYANETTCNFQKICKHVPPPSSSTHVCLSFVLLFIVGLMHNML